MAPRSSSSSRSSSWRSSRPSSRHPHQTAPREKPPRERVTVTMPVHPLSGIPLAIVRMERDQHGRRYVTVEDPRGGNLRLPVEWTDRSAPTLPPKVEGQEVRVSIGGLRALASAVAVALARKLDPTAPVPAPWSQAEQTTTPSKRSAGRMVGAVGDRTARPARGGGVAAAQGPASERGGPR